MTVLTLSTETDAMAEILFVGATGLVGSHVLKLLLGDDRFTKIIAPVRRPVPPADKLVAPVVDFDALPSDVDWWDVDTVICTIGTTIRKAGSREAFRKVDHDLPLLVARTARARGASSCVVVTALGAAASSHFFYNRTKGELEEDLATLGFPSLTFVRPGLIGGERPGSRPLEKAASLVLGALRPILPRSFRINPVDRIAEAIVEAAGAGRLGVHVVTSREMT